MGCGRESRPSEITFKEVFAMMPNLACCIWHGKQLKDDAKEDRLMTTKPQMTRLI